MSDVYCVRSPGLYSKYGGVRYPELKQDNGISGLRPTILDYTLGTGRGAVTRVIPGQPRVGAISYQRDTQHQTQTPNTQLQSLGDAQHPTAVQFLPPPTRVAAPRSDPAEPPSMRGAGRTALP